MGVGKKTTPALRKLPSKTSKGEDMRQGVNIPTLQLQLKDHSEAIKDFKGHVSNMSVSRTQAGNIMFNAGEFRGMEPTDLFHDQLATHMEIPKKYYKRIEEKHSSLFESTVNTLIKEKDEQRLVRTVAGEGSGHPRKARAFLSTSYRRVDNHDVAAWFLKAMESRGGANIFETASLQMTENYLYMKMTMPTILRGTVRKVGDVIEGGICLRNSEVGLGALKLERFYKRLVCLNGMVRPYMAMRHIGKKENVDSLEIQESIRTENLEDALVISRLADAIDKLMDKDAWEEELELMRSGIDVDLSRRVAPPSKIVEVVGRRMGMNEGERESVFENWMRNSGEDGCNAWSLANAVTAHADGASSYDRATEFETLGYKILDTGTKEWETIAREAEVLAVAA
jgi:hypothetical protein